MLLTLIFLVQFLKSCTFLKCLYYIFCEIKYINFPDYFSDNDLKLQNLKFDYERCLGSSGEAFAIDTANCFHMGSRSKKDRLQIIIAISPYASTLYPHKSIIIDKDLIDFNHLLYSKYKSQ